MDDKLGLIVYASLLCFPGCKSERSEPFCMAISNADPDRAMIKKVGGLEKVNQREDLSKWSSRSSRELGVGARAQACLAS
jgi:hypothetical protein